MVLCTDSPASSFLGSGHFCDERLSRLEREVTFNTVLFSADESEAAAVWVAGAMVLDTTGLARGVTFKPALFAANEREAAVAWVGAMALAT